MKKKFVDSRFVKGKRYASVIEDIVSARVCPLCPKTMKWHTKPILKRRGSWLITENFSPYKNAARHYIILGKKHKEAFEELTLQDFADIRWLVRWAIREFHLKGGGVTMRFGETAYTGATVCHLHAHLIVPKIDKKTKRAKPVFFPIG